MYLPEREPGHLQTSIHSPLQIVAKTCWTALSTVCLYLLYRLGLRVLDGILGPNHIVEKQKLYQVCLCQALEISLEV